MDKLGLIFGFSQIHALGKPGKTTRSAAQFALLLRSQVGASSRRCFFPEHKLRARLLRDKLIKKTGFRVKIGTPSRGDRGKRWSK
jgi:hypothetical protein